MKDNEQFQKILNKVDIIVEQTQNIEFGENVLIRFMDINNDEDYIIYEILKRIYENNS